MAILGPSLLAAQPQLRLSLQSFGGKAPWLPHMRYPASPRIRGLVRSIISTHLNAAQPNLTNLSLALKPLKIPLKIPLKLRESPSKACKIRLIFLLGV